MLNNVSLMGRIASDLELKNTPAGVAVVTFPLAVEKNFANSDGKRETNFFQVVAWRHNADFISKFFKKGDTIVITGELSSRDWSDKDGRRRREIEIVVSNVYFASSRNENAESKPAPKPPERTTKETKEDLPFYQSENDSDPWA